MIAVTGALIGLSQVFLWVLASIFYAGDTDRASASLFNPDQEASHVSAPMADIGMILSKFQQEHPDLKPLAITVHEPATTAQTVAIDAKVPRRIVWAELFQFNADGELLNTAGWSQGEVGTQLYASTYRIHFGHFAGLPLKFVYLILGVIMCIVAASGVNIWLLRKQQKGQNVALIKRLWVAVVWGTPLAVVVSALLSIATLAISPVIVFWLPLSAIIITGGYSKSAQVLSSALRFGIAIASLAIVIVYALRFGEAVVSPAALLINLLWVGFAMAIMAWLIFVDKIRWRSGSLVNGGLPVND